MKTKIKPILLTLSFTLLAGSLSALTILNKGDTKEVSAYNSSSLPTTIDLNDTSAANIRSYYSSLNNLSTSERQGNNLLKNLKTILKNGQKYLSYDSGTSIWDVYCIVDRDWEKSPASSLPAAAGTYNSNTNIITNYNWGKNADTYENPYLHALYYNRSNESIARAYGDHGNNTSTGINREHIWPKGAGFDTDASGGARGDIMHLWAAHGHTNNKHSNFYYGYVDTTKAYTDEATDFSVCAGNLLGFSKTLGGSTKVFEPQDSDKGDIARAVFYMVARYNYLSGSDSDGIDSNNPNLELVNDISSYQQKGYTSSTTTTGKLGIIQDLLEWNRLDPPDEFEIHRNNLCYTNFTNNRNPFIDYPEWAEYIWGKSVDGDYDSTVTGYATPSSDTISAFSVLVPVTGVSLDEDSLELAVGDDETLTATVSPNNATNTNVSWTSSNTNVATVNNGVVTAVAAGNATITVTTEDGSFTDTCSVTVTQPVSSVSLNTNSLELEVGGTSQLTATVLPNNASNKNVTWQSNNTNVATVSNTGLVTAVATGNATITVTTVNGGKTATCTVTVTESSGANPGDAVLYSNALVEGNYVLYYNGKAMKNTVSNKKRFEYSEVTPSDDIISAPNSNIVWHIAQSGDYWTLYNEAVEKYAAGTGTKNEGALIDSVTDYAKWTVTRNNGVFEFTNKGNSDAEVNCLLRNNGTYGFACYSDSTGGALSLYKVVEGVTPTSLTATVNKDFYVGETITKSDITVKDNLGNTINDFEFENYQFTYSDSKPSGEPENKHFNISYNEMNADLSVDVYRESPYEVETLSKYNSDFSFVTATSAGEASNFIGEVNGITYHADNCYRYSDNLSFVTEGSNKEYTTTSSFYNSDPYSKAILEVYVSSSMNNYLIEYSENGTNWSAVNSGDAHYFKISYVETVTGFINIYYIDVSFMGDSNSETLSNYVMYEDTENQCLSKLDVAINIFENMTSEERSTFMTSEDYVISNARTRFNAWLTNQGKSVSYQSSDYVVGSSTIGVNILDADNNVVLLLVVLSVCTFISCFSVIMYKRRSRRD